MLAPQFFFCLFPDKWLLLMLHKNNYCYLTHHGMDITNAISVLAIKMYAKVIWTTKLSICTSRSKITCNSFYSHSSGRLSMKCWAVGSRNLLSFIHMSIRWSTDFGKRLICSRCLSQRGKRVERTGLKI